MYDCKLMELGSVLCGLDGLRGALFLWWRVEGGWRMTAPVSPAVRFRAGGSGGCVGLLAEVWG